MLITYIIKMKRANHVKLICPIEKRYHNPLNHLQMDGYIAGIQRPDNKKAGQKIPLFFLNVFVILTFLLQVFYQVRFCDLFQTYVRECGGCMRIDVDLHQNACLRYQVIDKRS